MGVHACAYKAKECVCGHVYARRPSVPSRLDKQHKSTHTPPAHTHTQHTPTQESPLDTLGARHHTVAALHGGGVCAWPRKPLPDLFLLATILLVLLLLFGAFGLLVIGVIVGQHILLVVLLIIDIGIYRGARGGMG